MKDLHLPQHSRSVFQELGWFPPAKVEVFLLRFVFIFPHGGETVSTMRPETMTQIIRKQFFGQVWCNRCVCVCNQKNAQTLNACNWHVHRKCLMEAPELHKRIPSRKPCERLAHKKNSQSPWSPILPAGCPDKMFMFHAWVPHTAHQHLTPGHPSRDTPTLTQAVPGQNCLCFCAFSFPDHRMGVTKSKKDKSIFRTGGTVWIEDQTDYLP